MTGRRENTSSSVSVSRVVFHMRDFWGYLDFLSYVIVRLHRDLQGPQLREAAVENRSRETGS